MAAWGARAPPPATRRPPHSRRAPPQPAALWSKEVGVARRPRRSAKARPRGARRAADEAPRRPRGARRRPGRRRGGRRSGYFTVCRTWRVAAAPGAGRRARRLVAATTSYTTQAPSRPRLRPSSRNRHTSTADLQFHCFPPLLLGWAHAPYLCVNLRQLTLPSARAESRQKPDVLRWKPAGIIPLAGVGRQQPGPAGAAATADLLNSLLIAAPPRTPPIPLPRNAPPSNLNSL